MNLFIPLCLSSSGPGLVREANDVLDPPQPIRHTRGHRRSHPKALVNPNKVVVHGVNRNGRNVILDFLTEGVRQAREAAHRHPHREILALHIAGRNMCRIGIAGDCFALAAKAFRRAVSLLTFGRIAVDFDQHRIVDIRTEGILNRVEVDFESVRSKLNAVSKAAPQGPERTE